MTRNGLRTLVGALVLGAAVWAALGMLAAAALASPTDARRVSLTDARVAPSMMVLVPAHETHNALTQCAHGTYYSDISAYRWNGRALGAQRWTRERTLTYWRARHGRVTFDGITWRNRTRAAVLVAGWCE